MWLSLYPAMFISFFCVKVYHIYLFLVLLPLSPTMMKCLFASERHCTHAFEIFVHRWFSCEISLLDACKIDHSNPWCWGSCREFQLAASLWLWKTFSGWKRKVNSNIIKAKLGKLDEDWRWRVTYLHTYGMLVIFQGTNIVKFYYIYACDIHYTFSHCPLLHMQYNLCKSSLLILLYELSFLLYLL